MNDPKITIKEESKIEDSSILDELQELLDDKEEYRLG